MLMRRGEIGNLVNVKINVILLDILADAVMEAAGRVFNTMIRNGKNDCHFILIVHCGKEPMDNINKNTIERIPRIYCRKMRQRYGDRAESASFGNDKSFFQRVLNDADLFQHRA